MLLKYLKDNFKNVNKTNDNYSFQYKLLNFEIKEIDKYNYQLNLKLNSNIIKTITFPIWNLKNLKNICNHLINR